MGYALFVKHISITSFRADGSIAERCCNFQHTQATAAVHLNVGLGTHIWPPERENKCAIKRELFVVLAKSC